MSGATGRFASGSRLGNLGGRASEWAVPDRNLGDRAGPLPIIGVCIPRRGGIRLASSGRILPVVEGW